MSDAIGALLHFFATPSCFCFRMAVFGRGSMKSRQQVPAHTRTNNLVLDQTENKVRKTCRCGPCSNGNDGPRIGLMKERRNLDCDRRTRF